MATNHVIATGDPLRVTQAAASSILSGIEMIGVVCSTSTGGTLTITDTPPAGPRTLINAMPLIAGGWYPIPIRTVGQVTITVGGTGDVLVVYNKD